MKITSMNSSLRLLSMCCVAFVLVACNKSTTENTTQSTSSAAIATDLSGVWRISSPTQALRTIDGKAPPLKPEAQKIYDERVAANAKGTRAWDTTLKCKPPGEPRALLENSWPFQIGQADDRVIFMFQWNRLKRVIEMGKQLPDFDGPFYFGRSSGAWQGDTLVATVIGVREQVALDSTGLPHSEDMKLIERFRLIDGGKKLEARLHIDDPATYTQAWETVLTFDRQPEDAIVEDNCLDRINPPNYYKPTLNQGA